MHLTKISKYFLKFFILSTILTVTACTTVVVPEATGGSKADAVVELTHNEAGGLFETLDVKWDKAEKTARERCQAWGYKNAVAFGASKSECAQTSDYGCLRYLVTTKYQCT